MQERIKEKEPLVSVVDATQKVLCAMPYDFILQQKLCYVRLLCLFMYKNAVLLAKTPTNKWTITSIVPWFYGVGRKELVITTLARLVGIEGVRLGVQRCIEPNYTQPFFQYWYVGYVTYSLPKVWDETLYRFVDIQLLQQSIKLEPEAFSAILIEFVEFLGKNTQQTESTSFFI